MEIRLFQEYGSLSISPKELDSILIFIKPFLSALKTSKHFFFVRELQVNIKQDMTKDPFSRIRYTTLECYHSNNKHVTFIKPFLTKDIWALIDNSPP